MAEPQVEPVKLFADGLALVYHEARHVRFLIKASHMPATGWQSLVSLPKNRVQAWRDLQSVRQAGRFKPTAREAARLFEERFGQRLEDLEKLYENPNWKHATAVGGHAWRGVTKLVSALGQGIDQCDLTAIATGCTGLLQAKHNNGPLRQKIVELDDAVGSATDAWWRQSRARP